MKQPQKIPATKNKSKQKNFFFSTLKNVLKSEKGKNLTRMQAFRGVTLLKQPLSSLGILNLEQQKCGLKIHKSDPPPKMTVPVKNRLPILPKMPIEFTNYLGKVPRGKTHFSMQFILQSSMRKGLG